MESTPVLIKSTPTQMNFLAGAGTVMCIAPASYPFARFPQFQRSDLQALHTDWMNIGNDLRAAMHAHPVLNGLKQAA
jgi:hypothetical protein